MLHRLEQLHYDRAWDLFQPLEFQLASHAVLDGVNPGICWVDNPDQPRSALLASPEGTFLAGDPTNEPFNAALRRGIFEQQLLGEDLWGLFITFSSERWLGALTEISEPRIPLPMPRQHYLCDQVAVDWKEQVPAGFRVAQITAELLDDPAVPIPEHIDHWMKYNWGSVEDFLARGFGVSILHGNTVVAWSLADCISRDACEIGIHTAEGYRRRGLATLTAAATVEHAFSMGLTRVGWHCDQDNLGSSRTAEKVGFVRQRDYTTFVVFLDETRHRQEWEKR